MLGEKIKKFRKSLGMTQVELAKKVGYRSGSTITEIEKGNNDIPFDKLKTIAQALGVSVSDLLEDNKPKVHDDPYFIDTSFLNSEERKELDTLLSMNTLMFMKNGGLSETDEKILKHSLTKAFLQAREEYNKKNKKWLNMLIADLIKYTLKLKEKYDSNINHFIQDLNFNIKIEYIEFEDNKNIFAYNFKAYDSYYIFLNSKTVNSINKDFVLSHELAHILLHDDNSRMFNSICVPTDKFETQANIFATFFLGYEYRECSKDDKIQKVINYIRCNFKLCDLSKTI